MLDHGSWRFIRAWNSELKNFLLLLLCTRSGWRGFAVVSIWFNAVVIALASLEWIGIAKSNLKKYIIQCENVTHSTVWFGNFMHFGQIGLLVSIDFHYLAVGPGILTGRRLLHCIGMLATSLFLNNYSLDTWDK